MLKYQGQAGSELGEYIYNICAFGGFKMGHIGDRVDIIKMWVHGYYDILLLIWLLTTLISIY